MRVQSAALLSKLRQEMEDYFADRSEQWQDTDPGQEFQERLTALGEILLAAG